MRIVKKLNREHLRNFNEILMRADIEPFQMKVHQLNGFLKRYAPRGPAFDEKAVFSLTGRKLNLDDVSKNDILVERLEYLYSITQSWYYAVVSFTETTENQSGEKIYLTYTDNAIILNDTAYIIPWYCSENDYIFSIPLTEPNILVIKRFGKVLPKSFNKETALYARNSLNL